MAYRIEFSAEAERDLEITFEFLVQSYLGFGEDIEAAVVRAEERVRAIRADADRIGVQPFLGTLHPEILPHLRHVTINRAVFWFDADETTETVRVLAVFFGGQDHYRRMLTRLLDG